MRSPAFQFYPEEFLVGTALFTNEEKGIYMTLLCYQWAHGRLPSDLKKISHLASCTVSRLDNVLKKFDADEDGLLFNLRLDRERIKQAAFRLKQHGNGVKGGRPTKPKQEPKNNPSLNSGLSEEEPKKSFPFAVSNLQTASTTPQSPPMLPKSVEDAIAMTAGAGVPEAFAKEVFLEHEGTTWTFAGKPVTNWKSYVSSRWMKVRDIQAQREKTFQNNRKPVQATPPPKPPDKPPDWLALVTEALELINLPDVDVKRVVEIGKTLPRAAWTYLDGEDYNKFNKIMKENS